MRRASHPFGTANQPYRFPFVHATPPICDKDVHINKLANDSQLSVGRSFVAFAVRIVWRCRIDYLTFWISKIFSQMLFFDQNRWIVGKVVSYFGVCWFSTPLKIFPATHRNSVVVGLLNIQMPSKFCVSTTSHHYEIATKDFQLMHFNINLCKQIKVCNKQACQFIQKRETKLQIKDKEIKNRPDQKRLRHAKTKSIYRVQILTMSRRCSAERYTELLNCNNNHGNFTIIKKRLADSSLFSGSADACRARNMNLKLHVLRQHVLLETV